VNASNDIKREDVPLMVGGKALPVLRAAAVLGAAMAGTTGAWRLARPSLAVLGDALSSPAVATLPFDVVVLGLCGAALLGSALWLLATTTVAVTSYVVGELAPGSAGSRLAAAVAHRVCPALLRRLVAAGLGVAVTAGVAAPAMAAGSGGEGGRLTGLPVPDRVTGRTPPVGRTVSVRPGQSLWSISAGLLPANATDALVTTTWHRLYRANVARVGPDPDLVRPGMRLAVPDLNSTTDPGEDPR
jgi:hypothetical protein